MDENDFRNILIDHFIETYSNEYINDYIMRKVWNTLYEVTKHIPEERICYIGLYGSQNYMLDTENSDIDCQCFIFPSLENITFDTKPISTTIKTQYGECVIKDIRSAINEILKSSPNILEVFGTAYSIVNRDYQKLITDFCNKINDYAHLSEYKFLLGLRGIWNSYNKDVSIHHTGKAYANVFRIGEMIEKIIDEETWYYPSILISDDLDYLKWIKGTHNPLREHTLDTYDEYKEIISKKLSKYFDSHEFTYIAWTYEEIQTKLRQLMKRYLKLTL